MAERSDRERELRLMPNEYAYVLDETKGNILALAGPDVQTLNQTEVPVSFDPATNRFQRCQYMEDAVRLWPEASEGQYLVLRNPARDQSGAPITPHSTQRNAVPELQKGRTVNLPGPCTFPLWPGQSAQVIPGHRLRSNQYLVVRVYNPEEAVANWGADGVMQIAEDGEEAEVTARREFTDGELIVIKGSEVKFFIPPTGVEVVQDTNGQFVRDAVSLERLEYCVLVNENGEKRYEQGPQVVFPEPTEEFVIMDGRVKHRAIELDDTWGIFVKVTEDYREGEQQFLQGQQLFITGEEQRIYIPRKEHSIVTYGGERIHYGVAIPEGSARYVLDKRSGEVKTVRGPCILLPDPRREVIVRRTLSDAQCKLMFPENPYALEHNRNLRQVAESANAPVSEQKLAMRRLAMGADEGGLESCGAADEFERRTSYTKPRTIQIDDKYEGAVVVKVWPNYAIKVVNSKGEAQVISGPQTVILDYDQELQAMSLSTGKPKTTDDLLRTVYLQARNNQVGDIFDLQTRDQVNVKIKVSLRINFESDEQKWFDVDNYVKFICDRIRSICKNMAKKHGIEELNARYVELVRDCILGTEKGEDGERLGRTFRENDARITDVEVLGVRIGNESIAGMLIDAQHETVAEAIGLASAERRLEATRRTQRIEQEEAELRAQTQAKRHELEQQQLIRSTEHKLARIAADEQESERQRASRLKAEQGEKELQDLSIVRMAERSQHDLSISKASADQRLEIAERNLEQRIAALQAEAEAVVKQGSVVTPQLVAAIEQAGHAQILETIGANMSIQAALQQLIGTGEDGVLGLAQKIFKGTGIDTTIGQLSAAGNGAAAAGM